MFGVVVLSYNHPEITTRCVQSVLNHVPSTQVALLHNGSEPQWIELLMEKFPHIEHWIQNKNLGFSGGANLAFRKGFSRWSWLLFLTNDTQLLTPIELPNQPGLYSPLVYLRSESRIDFRLGVFDSRRGKIWHHRDLTYPQLSKRKGVFSYAPGTALLMHQSVFKAAGEMDETGHTFWEDVDFGVRAMKVGFAPQHWDQIRIIHAGGKTTRKHRFYTQYLFQRNRHRISWRHCPWWAKPMLALKILSSVHFYRTHLSPPWSRQRLSPAPNKE